MRALVAADIPALNQSTTGNAATATKLATARTIAGQSFDGSANITISASDVGALASGSTAVAATKLATARAINGVSFDGTADITVGAAWSDVTSTPTTLAGYGITDAATAAQGAKADTAVQPGSLGTAAATDATAYATAAQGATADAAWPAASLTGATKIAVVATLPGTPDANTVYIVTT